MARMHEIPFHADGVRLARFVAIERQLRRPEHDRRVQKLHRQPDAAPVDRTKAYARIERGHEA